MICSCCKENKKIYNKTNLLCKSCYNKYHPPKKRVCSCCKELKKTKSLKNNKILCEKCYNKKYKYKEGVCNNCNKIKRLRTRYNGNLICDVCKIKIKYPLESRLRKRLCKAFKLYSENGKIYKTKEYEIDYQAIFNHIGPCPGNKKEYHIDHIFPLSAFDFDDPIQVKIAFSPENHRWLKAEDNLRKGSKYNEEELRKFIKNLEANK